MNRGMLARVARKLRPGAASELPPPSADEKRNIAELRAHVRRLPVAHATGASASKALWLARAAHLRTLVLTRDPREFLSWDVIGDAMFVGNAAYVSTELSYLQARPDWTTRWRAAIEECAIGRPTPFNDHPSSSGNLIHHAFHVARFEETTGALAHELGYVCEFGGGYGSMCRLFFNLGFRGQYTIVDLPELSALQKYFLTSAGVPVESNVDCVSSLDQLSSTRRWDGRFDDSLFIATWSLSETPATLRQTLQPFLADFKTFLLSYQDRFGETDNIAYFNSLKTDHPGVKWTGWPIAHLPGNHYLVGIAGADARPR